MGGPRFTTSASEARSRELEDRLAIAVLDHRHDEAGVGRGGDADVVVLAINELVRRLVERAVQDRVLLERRDARLHDEREEAELHARLLRGRLHPRAQLL